MADASRLIYWDACVFLSYINDIADRLPVIDALLVESEDPKSDMRIITSTISIAEVAYAESERGGGKIDPRVEDAIDALWESREAIMLVEVTELIVREARTLIRAAVARGWSLRAHDAIHLATARHLKAAEFHTYDDRLDKYTPLVGFPITRPQTRQPRLLDTPTPQDPLAPAVSESEAEAGPDAEGSEGA